MRLEYFDVDRIVTMFLRGERVNNSFVWENERPIKRFFGLIDTGKTRPAGYYDTSDWRDDVLYTEEQIRSNGYKVYSRDERINDNVVEKAYVKIDLEHDNSVNVQFETETEMREWVDKLIEKSKTTFEVVNYDK
jgi:hypothetical protein